MLEQSCSESVTKTSIHVLHILDEYLSVVQHELYCLMHGITGLLRFIPLNLSSWFEFTRRSKLLGGILHYATPLSLLPLKQTFIIAFLILDRFRRKVNNLILFRIMDHSFSIISLVLNKIEQALCGLVSWAVLAMFAVFRLFPRLSSVGNVCCI